MAKMPKDVVDLFNNPNSAKVLATVGAESEVNVVPKGSLRALNEETIAFADIFGGKTNRNLETNRKVAVLAFTTDPLSGYQVKGTFQGFQTSGEVFDRFAEEIEKRLGLEIRAVGLIAVEEVYAVGPPEPGKRVA